MEDSFKDKAKEEQLPVGDIAGEAKTSDQPDNAALKRALERVKKDAEAELHAGHHTYHNSHSSHNTCMII